MDESNPFARVSRRTVVQGAAAVAAAGTASLALAGTAQAAAAPAASTPSEPRAGAATEAGSQNTSGEGLVVHVRDVATGDLDVYSGERHTAVRDPKLAKLLAALAR